MNIVAEQNTNICDKRGKSDRDGYRIITNFDDLRKCRGCEKGYDYTTYIICTRNVE